MPIQGFVRFRKHQMGKQSAIGTPVAATRIFPYRGNLGINLNWTDPDVDVGSIDPVLAPYRSGSEITESLTGPLQYNDIPTFFAAGLIGGVSPTGGGSAKTWTHTAQSTSSTTFDYFTDEWGDDVTADGAQAFGHIPVDVHAIGCDAYSTSPHKWLLAPKGTGLLYLRRESSARIQSTRVSASRLVGT